MILKRLRREIKNGGCLDEHNQDQFLLFMGLGEGKSRIRIGEKSDHTKSMLYVL
jgi:RNA 3'-terminal phosphate cyclase